MIAPAHDEARQHEPGAEPPPPEPGRRRAAIASLTQPALIAVLTAAVAAPICYAVPGRLNVDPFSARGQTIGVAGILVIATAVLVASRWRSGERVAGAAAGLLAAWMVLSTRTALHGTPYGALGLEGDANRMAAMANRFSLTMASVDAWHPGLPSEYPPLYPWLIGRASAITGTPAWRLLDNAQILAVALATLAGFLLWRRWFSGWSALVIAGTSVLCFSRLDKAYELLALVVFVPWALDTLAHPPRRRLPWLFSGLVAGGLVLVYWGWFLLCGLGLIALVVWAWRTSTDRRAYLRHVLAVAAVAAVVSSWYTVPLLAGVARLGVTPVADLWEPSAGMVADLFPIFDATPLGVLQLVGLVGMVLLRRSTWWARPMLMLTAGVFLFRVLATARYVFTGKSLLLFYTPRAYTVLLAIAGVLTVAHGLAALREGAGPAWLRQRDPRPIVVVGIALVLAWTGYELNRAWAPRGESVTAKSFLEPLPNGEYVPFAPEEGRVPWFPIEPVAAELEREWGETSEKVLLSATEKIYPFVPWHGYVSVGWFSANSLSHRPQRVAEVHRLSTIKDPEQFADAVTNSRFGPIDAFVLWDRPEASAGPGWYFSTVRFTPEQFDSPQWRVVPMPAGVVLIIRQ